MRPMTAATHSWLRPVGVMPTDRIRLRLDATGKRFHAALTGSDGYFASARLTADFPLRIPQRKEVKSSLKTYDHEWLFGATDLTVAQVRVNFTDGQVYLEDQDTETVFRYLETVASAQEHRAAMVARWKDKSRPRGAGWCGALRYAAREDKPLGEYQRVALDFCFDSDASALFMEQGTGKTAVTIARICNEAPRVEGRMYRVLIVCPRNVRVNWEEEFHAFATCDGQVTVVRGGQVKRMRAVVEALVPTSPTNEFTAIVLSYESMSRMVDWLSRMDWDLIVLDESHFIKGRNTQRTKEAHKLRDCGRQRMILTGTPICNAPQDLWAQLEFLGMGYSGFTEPDAFKGFHHSMRNVGQGVTIMTGVQNVPFLQERLARLSFQVKKEEVLRDLPPKVYDIREVAMTPEQAQVYREVATKIYVQIENELASGRPREMLIKNILTMLLRLSQITSGFVVWDPVVDQETLEVIEPRMVDRFDPNPKLEALVEGLKEMQPNEKALVWAIYVQDIKSISARLALEGIDHVTFFGQTKEADRELAKHRFNWEPQCRVFIGHPRAGGAGLNLHGYPAGKEGGDEVPTNVAYEYYFSQGWSSVERSQSEDRAHRRGTRTNVIIRDLVVPGTIDEEIRRRVLSKQLMALQVSDVREILGRLIQQEYVDE